MIGKRRLSVGRGKSQITPNPKNNIICSDFGQLVLGSPMDKSLKTVDKTIGFPDACAENNDDDNESVLSGTTSIESINYATHVHKSQSRLSIRSYGSAQNVRWEFLDDSINCLDNNITFGTDDIETGNLPKTDF